MPASEFDIDLADTVPGVPVTSEAGLPLADEDDLKPGDTIMAPMPVGRAVPAVVSEDRTYATAPHHKVQLEYFSGPEYRGWIANGFQNLWAGSPR